MNYCTFGSRYSGIDFPKYLGNRTDINPALKINYKKREKRRGKGGKNLSPIIKGSMLSNF